MREREREREREQRATQCERAFENVMRESERKN